MLKASAKAFKRKGNKLASIGSSDVFVQRAGSSRHRDMLVEAAKGSGLVLLVEDDLKTSPAAGSPVEVRQELTRAIHGRRKHHPRWCCLHSGSDPLWSTQYRHGPAKVAGISHSGCVMQAHTVLWNPSAKNCTKLIQEVCEYIDKGVASDDSYAYLMSKSPPMFF